MPNSKPNLLVPLEPKLVSDTFTNALLNKKPFSLYAMTDGYIQSAGDSAEIPVNAGDFEYYSELQSEDIAKINAVSCLNINSLGGYDGSDGSYYLDAYLFKLNEQALVAIHQGILSVVSLLGLYTKNTDRPQEINAILEQKHLRFFQFAIDACWDLTVSGQEQVAVDWLVRLVFGKNVSTGAWTTNLEFVLYFDSYGEDNSDTYQVYSTEIMLDLNALVQNPLFIAH